uniref:Uncharacterized protein n=1 Tax=Anguilla anguilla TaxID=7936 RepID=A0A0E9R8Y8_ANGAN
MNLNMLTFRFQIVQFKASFTLFHIMTNSKKLHLDGIHIHLDIFSYFCLEGFPTRSELV